MYAHCDSSSNVHLTANLEVQMTTSIFYIFRFVYKHKNVFNLRDKS